MGKKKSLGHSPLGFDFDDGLTYDFIPDLNEQIIQEVDHPEKDKMENASSKTVVSYYIEEQLVGRIKKLAHITDQSYSSVATNAFTDYLQKEGF
jgi:hypothetical protein